MPDSNEQEERATLREVISNVADASTHPDREELEREIDERLEAANERMRKQNEKRPQALLVVRAGVLPGVTEHERRWTLDHDEVKDGQTLIDTYGAASMQALAWQDPSHSNWVTYEWLWL